ncbi:hypothetical protein PAXRUDRAFT_825327 [Paxillus rubicundulus Ve08.2h10]|uniref:Unplaced genomic scaffold scaffold_132, whole genome shotgun sequence n=1 Tax=Paxillus rubicundulus Ve08.2h10 TaxID=930991 RepID=A0A0D0DTD4_9AGAM|nr:hypothetical protein PAXRUDRAFT_825327 [Paxillus rubicundulus Ve08.2h10]
MSSPVRLHVYDLSNGLARQMSMQLTGRQIYGIWHTSVIVFGKEVFYGQGISITLPGKSHHGSPLRVIDIGETAIDEETFMEYLTAMREHYTADKYHLLDFNCNSFTNDCVGFLTGGSIPDYIKSLPTDFLSTPFGAALRPTIDAMFRDRPETGVPTPPQDPRASVSASPNPALAANLLQAIAVHARQTGSVPGASTAGPYPTPAPTSPSTPAQDAPLTAPMNICTNPASFHNLLRTNRAVVAFFTSATCRPCRMIEPTFEELARNKSRANGGVAFAKIDLSVGMSGAVASEYGVRVTPTFVFFSDGRKRHELKGVNAPELRTQVDLLIYDAFPPHPHTSLSLPAIETVSLNAILFSQVPNLDTMFGKLIGFVDGVSLWTGSVTRAQVKQTLSKTVLPFLKASTATPPQPISVPFDHWPAITSCLGSNLRTNELFPVVDIWRIALLNAKFSAWSTTGKGLETIKVLVAKGIQSDNVPRNYLLTVARMLSNAFSNDVLARELIIFARDDITKFLVDALLHEDTVVRTAAASLAFNIAAYLQKLRVGKVQGRNDNTGPEESDEQEFEMVTAILGAIEQEQKSEEIVHRLTACLALLLRLSPFMEQLTPLLEGLNAREVLKGKLERAGCGETGIGKKEVRTLVLEVAEQLCPRP